MESVKSIKAFSDLNYDYYQLTKDLGVLPKGTIFYHDINDNVYGSISNGCLKLCWTPDGDCYGHICGGTVIFHTVFITTDLFEKVESEYSKTKNRLTNIITDLENQLNRAKNELKNIT